MWNINKNMKNNDFNKYFHNTTSTANLFEVLVMLPEICLTYNKVCPLKLLCPIQIHQHFEAILSGILPYN